MLPVVWRPAVARTKANIVRGGKMFNFTVPRANMSAFEFVGAVLVESEAPKKTKRTTRRRSAASQKKKDIRI